MGAVPNYEFVTKPPGTAVPVYLGKLESVGVLCDGLNKS